MKFKCPACKTVFRSRTVPFCGRSIARCKCGGMVDGKDVVPARHPVRWIVGAVTWPFRRKKTVRKFASGGIVSPKPVPVGIEPGVVTWPWGRKQPRLVSIKAADEESAKNWFLSLSPAAAESLRKIRTKTWTMGDSRPFSRPWALVDPEKPVQGEELPSGFHLPDNVPVYAAESLDIRITEKPEPEKKPEPPACTCHKREGERHAKDCSVMRWLWERAESYCPSCGSPSPEPIGTWCLCCHRIRVAKPAVVPAPWTPKVGEWVLHIHRKQPIKMARCVDRDFFAFPAPDNPGSGAMATINLENGMWRTSLNCLRPLALAEVQTEEQARQFCGKRVIHYQGGTWGNTGKISSFDSVEKTFGVMWDGTIEGRHHRAENLRLLPDSPEQVEGS